MKTGRQLLEPSFV